MTAISSIYRHGQPAPRTPVEDSLASFAACNLAWHEHGLLLIRVDDVRDDFQRQALTNYGNAKYGKRSKSWARAANPRSQGAK